MYNSPKPNPDIVPFSTINDNQGNASNNTAFGNLVPHSHNGVDSPLIDKGANGISSGGSAAGASGDVQLNTAGAFAADTGKFSYDTVGHILKVTNEENPVTTGPMSIQGYNGPNAKIDGFAPSVYGTTIGDVRISAGLNTGSNKAGGSVIVAGVDGTGSGTAGHVSILAGGGDSTTGSVAGGFVILNGGYAAPSGNGGDVILRPGFGGSFSGTGGNLILEPGAGLGGSNGVIKLLSDPNSGFYLTLNLSALTTADKTLTLPNQTATMTTAISGTGAPGTTPVAIGQIYCDTSGGKAYISTGTASSADWKILN